MKRISKQQRPVSQAWWSSAGWLRWEGHGEFEANLTRCEFKARLVYIDSGKNQTNKKEKRRKEKEGEEREEKRGEEKGGTAHGMWGQEVQCWFHSGSIEPGL